MIIDSERTQGDLTLKKCRFFGGGELGTLRKCFVARRGNHYAHGETLREAVDDVNFKILQRCFDLSEVVEEVKRAQAITVNQYRLLTGACKAGCEHFMDQEGIPRDTESLPLDKVLSITKNAFGGARMRELFL